MSPKVLVVDDSTSVLNAVCQSLERLGVEPAEILRADRAAKALEAFKANRPTVVFMDMDLGADRGDDLALEILHNAPDTKIVIMTGLDINEPRIRKVVSAGAYEVLQKPLRLAKLRQVIDLIESEDKGFRRI